MVLILEQGTGVDLHFAYAKLLCCHRPAGGKQQSTGLLHLNRFDSLSYTKERSPPLGGDLSLEQGTGVEPAQSAWEAEILPIN